MLLEEMEEGIISAFLSDDGDWMRDKFSDLRRWSPAEADNERVVWLRCHGVPIHVWNEDFFAALARKFGDFLGTDEPTSKKDSMDVARIKIRTRVYDVFNMVVVVNINGSLYNIKMVEEWCGPLQWISLPSNNGGESVKNGYSSDSSFDSEGCHGEDHPLFTMEDEEEWVSETDLVMDDVAALKPSVGTPVIGDVKEKPLVDVSMEGEEAVVASEESRRGMTEKYNDYVGVDMSPTFPRNPKRPNLFGDAVNSVLEKSDMVGAREEEVGRCNNSQLDGAQANNNKRIGIFGGIFEVGNTSNPGGCKLKGGPYKKVERKRPVKSKKGKSGLKTHHVVKTASKPNGKVKAKSKAKSRDVDSSHSLAALNSPCPVSAQPEGVVCNVVREPPLSSNLPPVGDLAIEEVSVGDSGIAMGNSRFVANLEKMVAEKMWKFAKEKLGVTSNENDEVCKKAFVEMEARDQAAHGKKGKKNSLL